MSPAADPPLADAARAADRLAMLGGSFDPPHLGHLHALRAAAQAFDLDHVVLVPASLPPHKVERERAPAADRVALLRLLLADEPRASVWGAELARPGPSYTHDTLRELRAAVGEGPELFFVVGADNLRHLAGWHEGEAMLRLARPITIARAGVPLDVDPALPPDVAERLRAGRVDVPPVAASSTAIRARLRAGEPPGDEFPPALLEYVRARGIY